MATFSGGQPPEAGLPVTQTLMPLTIKDGLMLPIISAKIQGPGLKTMADAVKNSSRGPSNVCSFAQIS